MNDAVLSNKGYVFEQTPGGAPIKAWTQGVPVDERAWDQLRNVARLPFLHKHVAVMPDVHWGIGATVGSVIPTSGANSCSHGRGASCPAVPPSAVSRCRTIAMRPRASNAARTQASSTETPGAYKDIDAVMQAQTSLVDIVHTLKQVVCVKG